jgi:hypothetical protein
MRRAGGPETGGSNPLSPTKRKELTSVSSFLLNELKEDLNLRRCRFAGGKPAYLVQACSAAKGGISNCLNPLSPTKEDVSREIVGLLLLYGRTNMHNVTLDRDTLFPPGYQGSNPLCLNLAMPLSAPNNQNLDGEKDGNGVPGFADACFSKK